MAEQDKGGASTGPSEEQPYIRCLQVHLHSSILVGEYMLLSTHWFLEQESIQWVLLVLSTKSILHSGFLQSLNVYFFFY